MAKKGSNLVWLDLEMTGLNPDKDRIIEIATIVTDKYLNVIEEGPVMAVHQSEALIVGMDDWNQKHHGASGLITRVRESSVTEAIAEAETLAFLKRHVKAGKSPLCGNSIGQDRRFLWRYMPALEAFFHYRNLDVSTLKILAQKWAPTIADGFKKESKHIALDDVKDSIDELKHYRKHFLIKDIDYGPSTD